MNPGRFLRALLSFPPTWLVLLVTAVAEWGFFFWFQPSFLMAAAAAALGAALLLLWPLIVARAAAFSSAYYDTPSRPTRDSPASLADLAEDLEKLGAPQGAQQMQKLAPLLDNLRAVLNRRLSAGELTYGRYLGAAEQVANGVVDNLRDVDVTLRSVRSIDADAIAERLNHLRRGGGYVGEEQRREIKSLEERSALVGKQNKRVAELLAQNEFGADDTRGRGDGRRQHRNRSRQDRRRRRGGNEGTGAAGQAGRALCRGAGGVKRMTSDGNGRGWRTWR